VENIIDDWVLMGFLVGNDFIPHLPNMHINKGALPELYTAYKVFAILIYVFIRDSVADPIHFGVDPDPRIHASD
jgi:5'-3' exonuclease